MRWYDSQHVFLLLSSFVVLARCIDLITESHSQYHNLAGFLTSFRAGLAAPHDALEQDPYLMESHEAEQFQKIRHSFGIDDDEVLRSFPKDIAGHYYVQKTTGKSLSHFFITPDGKYFVKSIRKREAQTLLRMLPNYETYLAQNANTTLLAPYLALTRVKRTQTSRSKYHVVMKSIFPPRVVIGNDRLNRTYDLKGSTFNRYTSLPNRILKDQNWIRANESILLINTKAREFQHAITSDSLFLRNRKIIDYSLLVGIESQPPPPLNNNIASPPRKIICDNRGFSVLYHVGIIDYLYEYHVGVALVDALVKDVKGLQTSGDSRSFVRPDKYQARFATFLNSQVDSHNQCRAMMNENNQ